MRTTQAAGGSNLAGASPAAFRMPDGMRMRYDVPAVDLAPHVTGYAIYISDRRDALVNWYLPAPAMIVVLLDAGPLSASIRNRSYRDIDAVSLWGPTSHAMRTVTHGGISVGIGLTAEGWGRLTGASATAWRNAVHPLAAVTGGTVAAALFDRLDSLDGDAAIAPALDRFLPALFQREDPDDAVAHALSGLILLQENLSVAEVMERLEVNEHALRRVATRYFGMPTKTLLSRARFVRSYAHWLMRGEPASYAGIDPSYFDASHFLRDARTFLGTTPRRFAALDTAYLRASLRARAAVIGAPAHALQAQAQGGWRLAG